jgi:hypothetical protein
LLQINSLRSLYHQASRARMSRDMHQRVSAKNALGPVAKTKRLATHVATSRAKLCRSAGMSL